MGQVGARHGGASTVKRRAIKRHASASSPRGGRVIVGRSGPCVTHHPDEGVPHTAIGHGPLVVEGGEVLVKAKDLGREPKWRRLRRGRLTQERLVNRDEVAGDDLARCPPPASQEFRCRGVTAWDSAGSSVPQSGTVTRSRTFGDRV